MVRAIESVFSQTYQDFELIVVDDGSDSAVRKAIEPYQKHHQFFYHYQKHQGVSAARNWGIRYSQSPWIAFLDSDDVWLDQKLAIQMAWLEQKPFAQIVQTQEIWFRDQKRVNPAKKHQKKSGWIFNDCLKLCLVSPSSVMIARSLFEDVGLFDENLPACEDYDLWLRIAARYPIYLIDDYQVKRFGGHEDQLSKKYWGMDRFRLYALYKLLDAHFLNAAQTQKVIQQIKFFETVLKKGATKRGYDWQEGLTWMTQTRIDESV